MKKENFESEKTLQLFLSEGFTDNELKEFAKTGEMKSRIYPNVYYRIDNGIIFRVSKAVTPTTENINNQLFKE